VASLHGKQALSSVTYEPSVDTDTASLYCLWYRRRHAPTYVTEDAAADLRAWHDNTCAVWPVGVTQWRLDGVLDANLLHAPDGTYFD